MVIRADDAIEALREAARSEASALVRLAAGTRGHDETIHSMIVRTADKLGWPYARTEDIWRGEARRIESFEMDRLRKFRRETKRRKSSENSEK